MHISSDVAAVPHKKPRLVPNYRQQLKQVLPAEYLKPDLTSLLWFPVHATIISLSFYLLATHFSYWIALPLALAVGHSFACMGFLAHDVAHGAVLKNAFLRDLVAGIGFSPLGIGPYLWRRWHNGEHHGNTQVEGIDPDHLFTLEHYRGSLILNILYKIHPLLRNLIIFGSFGYRMSQQNMRMFFTYLFSKKSTTYQRFVVFAQLVFPIAAWTLVTLALGTQVFIWGYLVPCVVANAIAISYIATNHFLNPLSDEDDETDPLGHSLSVTMPKWLKWIDPWHSYFGAHVAHHMFPQAPVKYSRQVEAKIAELWPDRYHQMPIFTALKLLWDTPWVYEDKSTLLDPRRKIRSKVLGHGLKHKKD